MNAPAKSYRSGTQWTEAQHEERGREQCKLRLKAREKEHLAKLAAEEGRSMSELVEMWVERAWAERKG